MGVLLSPFLLDAVKSIKHIYYGRRISDPSAVVMKLDWAATNTGQGIFRCGADTHRNKNYQELIRDSFRLNFLDFVGDTSKQNELRTTLGHILALKASRDKVSNDVTKSVNIRDIILRELDVKIHEHSEQYPSNDEIITEHFSGKYSDALVFLLHKAAEVTRSFNKKKTGSRRRERVELLNELNSVISDNSSTIQDIEMVEEKLVKFDEEELHSLLLRSENYRLLEEMTELS